MSRPILFSAAVFAFAAGAGAQQQRGSSLQESVTLVLPDAPSETLEAANRPTLTPARAAADSNGALPYSSSVPLPAELYAFTLYPAGYEPQQTPAQAAAASDQGKKQKVGELDANGNPITVEKQQPKRILGFMPNFRSVSVGAVPPKPSFKTNFKIATRQAFDYSSFIFLFLTTISAEGLNEHPVLGKGVHGFYSYGWRGFVDKTDGTYLGAFLLPSILHEDTRYYAMGSGHKTVTRILYVISRQAVTRTYGGHSTPNIAGLGGKVLTQVISRQYYPTGATSFGVLAEKFGYSVMRDVGFTSIREFYPDLRGYESRKRARKLAAQQAAAASATP